VRLLTLLLMAPLVVHERHFRRHRALDARPAQRHTQRPKRVLHHVFDGSALESTVSHAIVAARIATDAIASPVGLLHQLAEAAGVTLIGSEIARTLPAEDVVGGIAPRRALIGSIAGQKIEKQGRLVETPTSRALLAAREDGAKQVLALGASEKH